MFHSADVGTSSRIGGSRLLSPSHSDSSPVVIQSRFAKRLGNERFSKNQSTLLLAINQDRG